MVDQVQKEILIDLKLRFPYLKHGCEANIKTVKICKTYATTSHGKQPCNGVGGTVKCLVSNTSLQCINKSQIHNPHDMFQYCKNNIQSIKFTFITNDELIKT